MQLSSLCQLVTGWGGGCGCGHVAAAPSSSSVGFLIMKLGTNNRSCSSHFDIYLFADARVHSTQLYERERDTRCCLAIVCLRRKVNEEAARVDGECILYWVFGITQYNTIFYVCNRINMRKSRDKWKIPSWKSASVYLKSSHFLNLKETVQFRLTFKLKLFVPIYDSLYYFCL